MTRLATEQFMATMVSEDNDLPRQAAFDLDQVAKPRFRQISQLTAARRKPLSILPRRLIVFLAGYTNGHAFREC